MNGSLYQGFGGIIHKHVEGQDSCHTMRDRKVYRGVAPEIAEADVVAFLRDRRLTPCGSCLRREKAELAEILEVPTR